MIVDTTSLKSTIQLDGVSVEDVDGLLQLVRQHRQSGDWNAAVNRLPAYFVQVSEKLLSSRLPLPQAIPTAFEVGFTVDDEPRFQTTIAPANLAVLATAAHAILARVHRTIKSCDARLRLEYRLHQGDPLAALINARKLDSFQDRSSCSTCRDHVSTFVLNEVMSRLGLLKITNAVEEAMQQYAGIFQHIIFESLLADSTCAQTMSPNTVIDDEEYEQLCCLGRS
jgi:hypothetical protein